MAKRALPSDHNILLDNLEESENKDAFKGWLAIDDGPRVLCHSIVCDEDN